MQLLIFEEERIPRKNIKRITLAGVPFSDYIFSFAAAFERKGIRTNVIPFPYYKSGWRSYPKKLGTNILQNYYKEKILKKIIKMGHNSDCLILLKGDLLDPEDILTIKHECPIPVVVWLIDSLSIMEKGTELCMKADLVICYNKGDEEYLTKRSKTAKFLELAFDPKYYRVLAEVEKDIDLYYVGTMHPHRVAFLNDFFGRLSSRDLKIVVHGSLYGWHRSYRGILLKKKYPYLMKYINNARVSHNDINRMTNRAKICLNILPEHANLALNIRTYEILGSEGFQVINKNDILDDIFTSGKELMSFADIDELFEISNYYLAKENDKERLQIAQNGYMKAISGHTFEQRVGESIHWIEHHIF